MLNRRTSQGKSGEEKDSLPLVRTSEPRGRIVDTDYLIGRLLSFPFGKLGGEKTFGRRTF